MDKISVIIPTLNEEKRLPLLLSSIKGVYEIIISDAGSKDKTLQIAERYNCKIIKGGLPGEGRNKGAKVAKGNILFFIDADIHFKGDFLQVIREFRERNLGIASFRIIPEKGRIPLLLFNIFYNYPIILLENILPHSGMGIIVEKELFFKVNCFNEQILLGEDHDFGRRVAKISKFGVIRGVKVVTSLRRFERDGWIKTILSYFFCQLHMIFIGPVKKDIFNYRFNHYK